ncbi:hypothetical protein FZEAL_30 [Fusarium zealandicum]|uniref:Uncharacterized protein n=1 Tax=Fusarium zealandicum TaxID=1053134 RepID=A0A8H4UVN8_9HYPO|nr:hypothetical protein FZEAL_30 [Fusarium zealandicum]
MWFFDKPDNICPVHTLNQDARDYVTDHFSFQDLSMIIGGVCAGLSIITMMVFNQLHASHLSNPTEQVKIMRIGNLITMFSLFSLLSVCLPKAAVYLHPWLGLFEGLALGSFFLLLCDYISPNRDQRDVFLAAKREDGVKWFKTRWVLIFQMPIVSFIVALTANITQALGVYCRWKSSIYFARLWLNLIQSISLLVSIIAILQFYYTLKKDLARHRPIAKFFAFKLVLILTFLQEIVFWALRDTGHLRANHILTFADIHIGIPSLVICIEMFPLALFFTWAFPWSVYHNKAQDGRGDFESLDKAGPPKRPYMGGPLGCKGWLGMLNPSDTIQAIMFVFQRAETPGKRMPDTGDGMEEPLYPENHQLHPRGPRAGYE